MFLSRAYDTRLLQSIRHNCGEIVNDAIDDPEVIEIMLNPDGKIWTERYGQDQRYVGDLPFANGQMILSLVASALGRTVDANSPILEGEFPLDGSRFAGVFPPVVGPGASFSIRKRASKLLTLENYYETGVITEKVMKIIYEAVLHMKNIVVVGGTSSGKTTFVNAIIDCISRYCSSHRLIIIEDTAELQSKSPNTVFLHTHIIDELREIGMRQLAKLSMRYAPRRILVGEVRDAAALELLKLWNTGHPGGVGTFHADSAKEALPRLEELVEEAGLGPKRPLIGRAVDLVVYMEKTADNKRRVSSIMKVKGYNPKTESYETDSMYSASAA